MAKKNSLSSTMSSTNPVPGLKGNPGQYDGMDAPFNKPHSMGSNTIPVIIKDGSLDGHKPAKISSTMKGK